jgi:hypothetical protein
VVEGDVGGIEDAAALEVDLWATVGFVIGHVADPVGDSSRPRHADSALTAAGVGVRLARRMLVAFGAQDGVSARSSLEL